MKNLFDRTVYNEIKTRLDSLSSESIAGWGKMNVAQMLAHCKVAFEVPLTEKKLKPVLLGTLLGWMFKSKLYNDSPWKQNLPTSPNFIIRDSRNFDKEKAELTKMIDRFYNAGPNNAGKYPHPFFGRFTPEQWGQSMYKHLDHHLKQFGA